MIKAVENNNKNLNDGQHYDDKLDRRVQQMLRL